MNEPIRLVQTNLRETDDTLDPKHLVQQLGEFPANVLLMGMGGIAAHFPSKVESHYVSPHLPPGHDTFGEVLKEAHAHKIRVIGRFDFSKVAKPIYDAHPDWFFRKANGEPATYNGLYATCINGAYYREQTLKILGEALERYDVDGLFFNAPGQPASDYSGNRYGMCSCDSCKTRFQAMYHRPLPSAPDADYNRFIAAVGTGDHEELRRAHPLQASQGRILYLYAGLCGRHDLRIEHRHQPGPALVAVFGERERGTRAR